MKYIIQTISCIHTWFHLFAQVSWISFFLFKFLIIVLKFIQWYFIKKLLIYHKNIVAAFRGMHVSPAKHCYAWLPRKCDYRTDGRTDAGQSDPYVPLCFEGDTTRLTYACHKHLSINKIWLSFFFYRKPFIVIDTIPILTRLISCDIYFFASLPFKVACTSGQKCSYFLINYF